MTAPEHRERHWYDVRQYVVVLNNKKEFLCLQLPDSYGEGCGGKWVLPGGKLRPDENITDSLLREVEEETGLTVTMRGVFSAARWATENSEKYGTFWWAEAADGDIQLSDEHQNYNWRPLADADKVDWLLAFLPRLLADLTVSVDG